MIGKRESSWADQQNVKLFGGTPCNEPSLSQSTP
jgi:hypothetical protein